MTRIALSLLLVCTCMSLDAREARLSGANGDGGACPDLATAATAEEPAAKPRPATPAARKPAKPTTTTARGGSDGGRVSAPRWDSFLPGMFR